MVFSEKAGAGTENGGKSRRLAPCVVQGGIDEAVYSSVRCRLGGALFASAASAQDVQERTIRWGHLNNTDHPVSFGVQKFAEILLAKSGGKLKVREFASSQLGNELQQQSALRGGTQEMLSASTTSLATVVPEFGLLDFPFIVSTTEQAEALARAHSARRCSMRFRRGG